MLFDCWGNQVFENFSLKFFVHVTITKKKLAFDLFKKYFQPSLKFLNFVPLILLRCIKFFCNFS